MWDSVLPHCLRQYLKRVLRYCLRLHFAFLGLLRSLRPLYTLSLQLTVLLFIFKPHVSDCYSDLRPTLLDHYFAFGPSFCLSVLQLYSGSRYHSDFCPTVCPSVWQLYSGSRYHSDFCPTVCPCVLQLYSGFYPIVVDHHPDFCPTVCPSVWQLYSGSRYHSDFCSTVCPSVWQLYSGFCPIVVDHHPDFCPTVCPSVLQLYSGFCPIVADHYPDFCPTVCSSVLQLFFSGFCITVPDRQFRLLSHCLSQCLTTLVRVLSYRLRHRPDFCPTKYSNNLDHYIMFVPLSRTIIQSFTPLC